MHSNEIEEVDIEVRKELDKQSNALESAKKFKIFNDRIAENVSRKIRGNKNKLLMSTTNLFDKKMEMLAKNAKSNVSCVNAWWIFKKDRITATECKGE